MAAFSEPNRSGLVLQSAIDGNTGKLLHLWLHPDDAKYAIYVYSPPQSKPAPKKETGTP